jgi:membrane-associated protease RseP (regulator of RpoE activity)
VILAGVTVNILIAWLLFTVAIAGRGAMYEGPNATVARVVAGSAAASAGLQEGDRFLAVDGVAVDSWDELKSEIEARGGDTTTFTIERNGRSVQVEAVPEERSGQGFLGIAPGSIVREISLLAAFPEGVKTIGDTTVEMGRGIGRLVSPAGIRQYSENFTDPPKAGSQRDLERPRSLVGITDIGSEIVDGDIWGLLFLLGSVSLVLALFNLIPLLPFDGGHAAVVVYEAIASRVRGRTVRVDFRKLMPMTAVVLAVFITLGLSAMLLDVRDLAR